MAADQLPSVGQLQALTQLGSEYAVALRGGRLLSLRLQPAAEPLPRCVPASSEQTGFVTGGAKVQTPKLSDSQRAQCTPKIVLQELDRYHQQCNPQTEHCSQQACSTGHAGSVVICAHCRCALSQGLGLQYARQLASAGCRTLILASRTATLPREALEEFAVQGVAVYVVHVDSGDAAAMKAVLTWAQQHLPAITHHAHAAGVTGQTLLKVSICKALVHGMRHRYANTMHNAALTLQASDGSMRHRPNRPIERPRVCRRT